MGSFRFMATHAKKGYDAAKVRRTDDDLDRWRFASEIVQVISATPSDFSARIGIFALPHADTASLRCFTASSDETGIRHCPSTFWAPSSCCSASSTRIQCDLQSRYFADS